MDRKLLLAELAAAIAKPRLSHPTRVAIDGVDGVGKTTLADELADPVRQSGRDVIRASIDGFHNPRQRRYIRGSDSPEGYFHDSFNYELLQHELLVPLGPEGSRNFRRAVFDYRTDVAVDLPYEEASADAVLIFDGVFLLRPELASSWDLAIWVDAPFDVTVERAVARDARDGGSGELRRAYVRRYVPGQRIYLERCRPKQQADIVVNNTDFSRPEFERGGHGHFQTAEFDD